MTTIAVAWRVNASGFTKTHLAPDGARTLCGLDVPEHAGAAPLADVCEPCRLAAMKITHRLGAMGYPVHTEPKEPYPMRNETTTLGKITVERPHKRRPLNPDRVKALEESIAEIGVLNPLTVVENGVGGYRLVAGYHRLVALQKIKAAEVPIRIVTVSDTLAELAEIDENLIRSELTALERATVVGRRKEIYEILHPEAKHGGDRQSGEFKTRAARLESDDQPAELAFVCPKCDAQAGEWCKRSIRTHLERRALVGNEPPPTSFTEDTAKKTGRSKRAVQEDTQIAAAMKTFPAGVRKAIEKSPFADRKKDLLEIARMDDEERLEVFDLIESASLANEWPFKTLAQLRKRLDAADDDDMLRDAHGMPIPDDLAAFWRAMSGGSVQSVANSIRSAAAGWTKAKKALGAIRELHGRPVAPDEVLRALDEGFKAVRGTAKILELLIPDMLCPACKGADMDCGGCGGSGFLPESAAKEFSRKDESRKDSRKKRAKRTSRR